MCRPPAGGDTPDARGGGGGTHPPRHYSPRRHGEDAPEHRTARRRTAAASRRPVDGRQPPLSAPHAPTLPCPTRRGRTRVDRGQGGRAMTGAGPRARRRPRPSFLSPVPCPPGRSAPCPAPPCAHERGRERRARGGSRTTGVTGVVETPLTNTPALRGSISARTLSGYRITTQQLTRRDGVAAWNGRVGGLDHRHVRPIPEMVPDELPDRGAFDGRAQAPRINDSARALWALGHDTTTHQTGQRGGADWARGRLGPSPRPPHSGGVPDEFPNELPDLNKKSVKLILLTKI